MGFSAQIHEIFRNPVNRQTLLSQSSPEGLPIEWDDAGHGTRSVQKIQVLPCGRPKMEISERYGRPENLSARFFSFRELAPVTITRSLDEVEFCSSLILLCQIRFQFNAERLEACFL